ncbi:PepSY-associated TM helix domain-containing protein [Nitrobacter sp.]|uniref:PepSY-associated TM helix domain-containing protein n=1 Tax=Nitrobacter sp. TaxID=29420 RepID=UPI003F650927
MKPRTLRIWIWLHKWSSLISMVVLVMLCLTGMPLIFAEEIDHWLEPHPPAKQVQAGTPAPALQDLVDRAQTMRPIGSVTDVVFFLKDEPHIAFVQTAATHNPPLRTSYYYKFDRRTGELLGEEPSTTSGFMYVVRRLHIDMFAGLPGSLFLGAMGLLLVMAMVSGAVVYAPFMRKLRFGTVRTARGPRVRWLDLHNLLGIVTLAWLLVVGTTGSINTLAGPIEQRWQATELRDMLRPYESRPPYTHHVPIDVALRVARETAPDRRVISVFLPGSAFSGEHHYTVFTTGNTPLTGRLLVPVLIDAGTGELTAMREMPWYSKALFLSQPLHFGDYGGLPLKLIWVLLDIASIIVLGSGLYLWWGRRRASAETLEAVLRERRAPIAARAQSEAAE